MQMKVEFIFKVKLRKLRETSKRITWAESWSSNEFANNEIYERRDVIVGPRHQPRHNTIHPIYLEYI